MVHLVAPSSMQLLVMVDMEAIMCQPITPSSMESMRLAVNMAANMVDTLGPFILDTQRTGMDILPRDITTLTCLTADVRWSTTTLPMSTVGMLLTSSMKRDMAVTHLSTHSAAAAALVTATVADITEYTYTCRRNGSFFKVFRNCFAL